MKFSPACISTLLAPVLATAKLSVSNSLEVHFEPNKIRNVDSGDIKDNNKEDEAAAASNPTTESAFSLEVHSEPNKIRNVDGDNIKDNNKEDEAAAASHPTTKSAFSLEVHSEPNKIRNLDGGDIKDYNKKDEAAAASYPTTESAFSPEVHSEPNKIRNVDGGDIKDYNKEDEAAAASHPTTESAFSLEVHSEPNKIRNVDGGDIKDYNKEDEAAAVSQKKELIHHLVYHQEHQAGKSLEECNIFLTTTTTTANAAAAAATSDDYSLMKRKSILDKESIQKMDYGHLNRGTCSSPNDACVSQNKAIAGNGDFSEAEDASYVSIGYCVPLSVPEDIEYKNVVADTLSLIDKEEFNKEEERTESYYHNHPQYDHHHRQLDSATCTFVCPGERPDVSTSVTDDVSFQDLIFQCDENGVCPSDYPFISCWNTAGITDMNRAFYYNEYFNAPLECWDVSQVTDMDNMFNYAYDFNQPIGSWDVSQVKGMRYMFYDADVFNQSIDSWNVSQVTNMNFMFNSAGKFNQPIDSWDVSQVEYMNLMFSRATSFNQAIDTWDVSQVQYMFGMFYGANAFNQCLSTWAGKTSDNVNTRRMLENTDCPNNIDSPDPKVGPWCQNDTQGCSAPDECNNVDESDFRFKGKSCKKYLQKKTKKKCKNRIDGVLVADSCPSICKPFCPPCKNKSGKIKLENGKSFNCKKIKKKGKCSSITEAGPLAKEICPVACNFKGC